MHKPVVLLNKLGFLVELVCKYSRKYYFKHICSCEEGCPKLSGTLIEVPNASPTPFLMLTCTSEIELDSEGKVSLIGLPLVVTSDRLRTLL